MKSEPVRTSLIHPPFSLTIFVLFEFFVVVSQNHEYINLFPA